MSDPINAIAEWLKGLLSSWGLDPGLSNIIMIVIGVIVYIFMNQVRGGLGER